MKSKRQKAILDIISKFDVETQEDLVSYLKSQNFNVTQATISRDIKDMHLIKVQSSNGSYKYAVNSKDDKNTTDVRLRIFKDAVRSIEIAGHLVVVKTLTGSANAAAEAIDTMETPDVVGCIAGDNTIFVALRTSEAAVEFANKLNMFLHKEAI